MRIVIGFICLLVLLCPVPGSAGDAAPAQIRLFQAGQETAGSYLLGLEISLRPGWMTYWRHPGEAGIAPKFLSEGSVNLRSLDVLFPAPKMYHEGSYATIGYDGNVILPLRVMPEDETLAVTLKLKIDYAVCEKICQPMHEEVMLTLSKEKNIEAQRRIDTALKQVPSPAADLFGEATILKLEGDDNYTVNFPVKGAYDFAVLELSDGEGAYFSKPQIQNNESAFTFNLPSLPEESAFVMITAIAKDRAVSANKNLGEPALKKGE